MSFAWNNIGEESLQYFCFLKIDIVGHSRLYENNPKHIVQNILENFEEYCDKKISSFNGQLWTWQGDGGLSAFLGSTSADSSVECAFGILNDLETFNKNIQIQGKIMIRIAIHLGTAIYKKDTGRIHSEDINFVSHMEDEFCSANDICISQEIFKNLSNKLTKENFKEIGIFQDRKVYSKEAKLRDQAKILIDHKSLPTREETLSRYLKNQLRIYTTTADSYFTNDNVLNVIENKLKQGCKIRVLLLDQSSPFFKDREEQEGERFSSLQKASIENIKNLQTKFSGKIEYNFFNIAPTYQCLIIDDCILFLAIDPYGIKGTADFPCICIVNGPETEGLFKKFTEAFEKIWEKSEYRYDLITYHDSWISLDPIIKCRYNCQYCVLRLPGWTGKNPEQLYSAKDAVEELVKHKYFQPNKTVVCLGNRTDLFLEENIGYTFEIIQEIDKHGIKNPICITTKSKIPYDFIKICKNIRNLNLIIFLSYSGLPKNIEPGIDNSLIIENFKLLKRNNIKFVHFWRPLIPANASESKFYNMLNFVSNHARCSVIVGLKYCPELRRIFNRNPQLQIHDKNMASYGEWLLPEIERKLFEIAKREFPNYPIFKHTSCAVSYLLDIPDYNATIYRDDVCMVSNCPEKQRQICEKAKKYNQIPSKLDVLSLLDYLGLNLDFNIEDNKVFINGEIGQEDYIFLLHNLSCPIKAKIRFTNVWHGSIFKDTN